MALPQRDDTIEAIKRQAAEKSAASRGRFRVAVKV